jgi:hypothetical protein
MIKLLLRVACVVPAVACAVTACAPYVRSDVNRTLIGTVHCNTFAWAGSFHGNSPLRSTVANPLNESRLRAAIASHLSHGTIEPAPGNADCLVGYGIGATSVVEEPWLYDGWGYGWWGYPYGGWGWPGPYVYHEGVIAVDLYDAKSRQPLWHASVEQSLYGVTGDEAAKRIEAAVAAIFTKYPG